MVWPHIYGAAHVVYLITAEMSHYKKEKGKTVWGRGPVPETTLYSAEVCAE